jgi:hypothetical protein
VVSAWILSKQELAQSGEGGGHGGGGGGLTRPSQRRLDVLLEQCRHDVQALARLKHPCVLRLIAPLEESRTQLVFITEPLANSLADLLGGGGPAALPPALAQERRSLHLSGGHCSACVIDWHTAFSPTPTPACVESPAARPCFIPPPHPTHTHTPRRPYPAELEIKHGLLQVADGLHFLHAEAGLVHRGICPAAVVITAAGGWRAALSPQQGWWGALPKRVWGTTFAFLFVGEQPWSEATCGCCRGRRAGALRRTLPGLLYALPCLTRRPQASQAPGSWPALASRPRWSTGRTVAAALTTQTPTRSCCRA